MDKDFTENIYSTIINLSPLPVYVCSGEDMVVLVANQATLKAWGKDNSVIGKKFKEALPEMADQPFFDLLTKVYKTGIPYYTDNDRADFLMDGKLKTFYFKFSYQPLKDQDGVIWGVLCLATDITDLVLANKKAKESELRFKNLILKAPVALCVFRGPSFVVEVVNEEMLKIWGITQEQVLNKPVFEAFQEARGQGLEELITEVYTTGKAYVAKERYVDLLENGLIKTKVLNFVYEPYREIDGTITGIMAAAVDVTDLVIGRRDAEDISNQLERTQHRLKLALEAGRLGTYERNLSTGTMIASSQFKENFGLTQDANTSLKDIMQVILPGYLEPVTKVYMNFETEEDAFDLEFPVKWPDESVHWVKVSGKPILNEKGERIISGVSQDITEQKRLQQQKDDFIGIASHELKTPITSLKASLQLLKRLEHEPQSAMVPKLIDQANVSLNKVSVLIEALLDTTKIKEGQLHLNKSRITLSKLVADCCQHVRTLGVYEIRVTGDLELEVWADAGRLDQVMVNFVNNAVKYAPDSKVIIIKIEKAGKRARVSVSDKGPGIPKDKLPHLFDRYYRVDEKGQPYSGLGLGLYISAEIIRRHHGTVGVESELGKGSTFWFELPIEIPG